MWGRGATDLPTLSMNQWILEVRLFHLFVAPAGADLESAKDLHTTEASPILKPSYQAFTCPLCPGRTASGHSGEPEPWTFSHHMSSSRQLTSLSCDDP